MYASEFTSSNVIAHIMPRALAHAEIRLLFPLGVLFSQETYIDQLVFLISHTLSAKLINRYYLDDPVFIKQAFLGLIGLRFFLKKTIAYARARSSVHALGRVGGSVSEAERPVQFARAIKKDYNRRVKHRRK